MTTGSDKDLFGAKVDQQTSEHTLAAVRGAIARREDGLTAALVRSLREIVSPAAGISTEAASEEWVGIESLSRLRSVVGGRFQNIKKKWVDAGFPLREHRGDRWKDFTVDKDAWLDLAAWIAKQGFEARLTPDSEEYLFQLRAHRQDDRKG